MEHSEEILDQDGKPAVQTPNPVAPCVRSKDLDGSSLPTLQPQPAPHFHPLYAAFPGRHPVVLVPVMSWVLQCSPAVALTVL